MAEKKKTAAKPKKAKEEKIIATVTGGKPLNVRPVPSKDNDPIGRLESGAEVEILEVEDDWCRIKGGYVMRQFLQF